MRQLLQGCHARAQALGLALAVQGVFQRQVLVVRALQGSRLAGAALVDEHQVALVVEPGQAGQHRGCDADGALARATGQQQDSIGALVARHGGHNQVMDIDLRTVNTCGVQRAADGAALHLVGNAVYSTGLAGARSGPGYCAAQRKRCARAKNQVPSGPLHTKSSPPKKKHRWCRCLAELHLRWMQSCALLLAVSSAFVTFGPLRLPFTCEWAYCTQLWCCAHRD